MDGNSGFPPEITVLCSTTETKEHAIRLVEWIRGIPDIQSDLARDPAIPAVCSLIASEQLGNTVVSERRALNWSQSTPEHFKMIMDDVRELLTTSRAQIKANKRRLTFRFLVDEFCEANALAHMLKVDEVFRKAPGGERWQVESELVQVAIFFWACRWFEIPTSKSIENIQRDYNLTPADFRDVEDLLDIHCSSIRPNSSITSHTSPVASSSRLTVSILESSAVTTSDETPSGTNGISLQELAHEFGVGEDAMGGIRFLEAKMREKEHLKDLVDWDSTMGQCVIFYWTCSILKIPSAKHITLRNQYKLSKRDFDKLLGEMDLYRAEFRKKLEAFYAGNPALQLLPQSTQWPATSPANMKPNNPVPTVLVLDKSGPPVRRYSKRGPGMSKRGRPPKARSPVPISTEPASAQEELLIPLCQGDVLRRALILMRSFNATRLPASDADRVPPNALPALVALLACQQLGDGQIDELVAQQAAQLAPEEYKSALASVRALISNFPSFEEFVRHTAFDSLALEHGMSIGSVISMLHVRECLRVSRCLSIGMDWDSPLVICSVFFWTCAILKVPDSKQSQLRSRSLASKREFDSMLQLLNSHCTVSRHQLEEDSAIGAFWYAPPPSLLARSPDRRHPSFYGEQEIYLEEMDGQPSKRMKREISPPSEEDSAPSDGPRPPHGPPHGPRKLGHAPWSRKPQKRHDTGGLEPIYRPTVQFPPADWKPPQSLSRPAAENGALICSTSDSGPSKRSHTRYKTLDYEKEKPGRHERYEAWKPQGEEIGRQIAAYQLWVERMSMLYGPHWEQGILRVKNGRPFE